MHNYLQKVQELLKPKYNELSVYLTALTCASLLIVHPEFQLSYFPIFNEVGSKVGLWLLLFSIATLAGFILSILHVFIKRPKTMLEKSTMGLFTIFANGVAGIAAGIEMLPSRWSVLMLLPAWNIATGLIMLYQLGVLDIHQSITDENTSPLEILIASITLLSLFSIAHFGLRLSWALTFSLCIFYSSAFTFAFSWLISYLKNSHSISTHDK